MAYLLGTTSLCPSTTQALASLTEPWLLLCCLVTKPSECNYFSVYTVCFCVAASVRLTWRRAQPTVSFRRVFEKGASGDGGKRERERVRDGEGTVLILAVSLRSSCLTGSVRTGKSLKALRWLCACIHVYTDVYTAFVWSMWASLHGDASCCCSLNRDTGVIFSISQCTANSKY